MKFLGQYHLSKLTLDREPLPSLLIDKSYNILNRLQLSEIMGSDGTTGLNALQAKEMKIDREN